MTPLIKSTSKSYISKMYFSSILAVEEAVCGAASGASRTVPKTAVETSAVHSVPRAVLLRVSFPPAVFPSEPRDNVAILNQLLSSNLSSRLLAS